jgi:hypothetical protein
LRNLWPEAAAPPPGHTRRTRLKTALHAQVCGGRMNFNRRPARHSHQLARCLSAIAAAGVRDSSSDGSPSPAQGSPGTVQNTSIIGATPGGHASATVQTAPGASYSISYRTPARTSSTAQGLTSRSADANGMASWSWSIGPTTRPGTGTVSVTRNGASASSPIQIS